MFRNISFCLSLFTLCISLVLGAPPPAPPGGDKPGDAEKSKSGFFNFEEKTMGIAVMAGGSLFNILPEMDYLVTTYSLKANKTLSPNHSVEFTFMNGKNSGVGVTSFGFGYRPYAVMDLVAVFANIGLDYYSFKTYQDIGRVKKGKKDVTTMNLVIGGGLMLPLAGTIYGRMGVDFYFNPGTIMTLNGGIEFLF